MAVPSGFCEAEVSMTTIFEEPPFTIQYFVGATPITSVIPITGFETVPQIQLLLDNDPIRILSGFTITVLTPYGFNFTVLISKPSITQITDLASGEFNGQQTQPPVPFICNLAPTPTPKKKKRVVGRCPDEIILKIDTSHPQVKYCNTIYNFYGMDERGLPHYINTRSNISQRNTRTWWSLSI